MKKSSKQSSDMRQEYDFAKMKAGIRGKYARRYRAGRNVVLLDPEPVSASTRRRKLG